MTGHKRGVRCPHCGSDQSSVIDSRPSVCGTHGRRRRCLDCDGRYTTREYVDRGNPPKFTEEDPGVFVAKSDLDRIARELFRLIREVNKIKRGEV